jgi:hypothetical protein
MIHRLLVFFAVLLSASISVAYDKLLLIDLDENVWVYESNADKVAWNADAMQEHTVEVDDGREPSVNVNSERMQQLAKFQKDNTQTELQVLTSGTWSEKSVKKVFSIYGVHLTRSTNRNNMLEYLPPEYRTNIKADYIKKLLEDRKTPGSLWHRYYKIYLLDDMDHGVQTTSSFIPFQTDPNHTDFCQKGNNDRMSLGSELQSFSTVDEDDGEGFEFLHLSIYDDNTFNQRLMYISRTEFKEKNSFVRLLQLSQLMSIRPKQPENSYTIVQNDAEDPYAKLSPSNNNRADYIKARVRTLAVALSHNIKDPWLSVELLKQLYTYLSLPPQLKIAQFSSSNISSDAEETLKDTSRSLAALQNYNNRLEDEQQACYSLLPEVKDTKELEKIKEEFNNLFRDEQSYYAIQYKKLPGSDPENQIQKLIDSKNVRFTVLHQPLSPKTQNLNTYLKSLYDSADNGVDATTATIDRYTLTDSRESTQPEYYYAIFKPMENVNVEKQLEEICRQYNEKLMQCVGGDKAKQLIFTTIQKIYLLSPFKNSRQTTKLCMLLMQRLLLQNNFKPHQYTAKSGIFSPEDMTDNYRIQDFSKDNTPEIKKLVTQYQSELENILSVDTQPEAPEDSKFSIVSPFGAYA